MTDMLQHHTEGSVDAPSGGAVLDGPDPDEIIVDTDKK